MDTDFITEMLETCHQNRVNVTVLTGYSDDNAFQMGVRLTPWKQDKGRERMIIAGAVSVEGALVKATKLAQAGKWERIDYAARPWTQAAPMARWGANEA